MDRPVLTLATSDHDRTRAIVDGRVRIEGWEVAAATLSPEEIFRRAFGEAAFDIAELSLSSYLVQRDRGGSPYIALPAFVSRAFRHDAVYVRRGGDVTRPEDLRGRRVGVPEYQVTATVWLRAMFETQHGVSPADVDWVTGGVDAPGRSEKIPLDLPPQIRVAAAQPGRTLSAMLHDGEIAALICPRAPAAFDAGEGWIGRLYPDPRSASEDYYRKTGVFPIMHLVGLRASLAEAHPGLAGAAFRAYCQARDLAFAGLADTTALSTMLPWQIDELDRTRRIMGDDYWPYGLSRNRDALAAFVSAHRRQGLSRREFALDELFHPATHAS